jgi:hypothetical protein
VALSSDRVSGYLFLQDSNAKLPCEDNADVLTAVRLGWSVAEMRGRNWPAGPPGEGTPMPDHIDHALPLRIERSRTELRIEAQSVVAALAKRLHVDDFQPDQDFDRALNDQAKLLDHVRAPKVSQALQDALTVLRRPAAHTQTHTHGRGQAAPPVQAAQRALVILQAARADQQLVVVVQMDRAVTAAKEAVTDAEQQVWAAKGEPEKEKALETLARAQAVLRFAEDGKAGEANGLTTLDQLIGTLERAIQTGPDAAAQTGIEAILHAQQTVATAMHPPWEQLAELIWRFDAHVQDRLSAASETQAIGYQLGRGLAETYWALDPGEAMGSASWNFLLGKSRCGELSRMVGRLGSCWGEYTAPAIAGSVEVWEDVVKTPGWLGSPTTHSQQCLYSQTRRWYELIILGQDPTTLISPGALMKDYRTIGRALKLFWPQLAGIVFGLAFLAALLVLIAIGGASWEKTLYGILATVGLSAAGISGTLKNSAQAMLTRLRQDAYTDLVAIAVQTAPKPPHRRAVREAVNRRKLTTATPN